MDGRLAGHVASYAGLGARLGGRDSFAIRTDHRAAGAVGGVAKGDNTGANEWELSYTYPLSKRTLTYVGYHAIENDSQAGYNFNINSVQGATAAGFKPHGFVVGLVHFF